MSCTYERVSILYYVANCNMSFDIVADHACIASNDVQKTLEASAQMISQLTTSIARHQNNIPENDNKILLSSANALLAAARDTQHLNTSIESSHCNQSSSSALPHLQLTDITVHSSRSLRHTHSLPPPNISCQCLLSNRHNNVDSTYSNFRNYKPTIPHSSTRYSARPRSSRPYRSRPSSSIRVIVRLALSLPATAAAKEKRCK